ncbi:Outer membrane efflux protein [Pseudarcicella hirudinis]|uniref:Outer membrane efflux protein n=1 Tax=Pseudarcicella hirudinis TaxID=1079859 RepID=A0A1I5XAR8_9BACT|nr:Outer membrane efflux protein [Pseudarcicella hirudinis]
MFWKKKYIIGLFFFLCLNYINTEIKAQSVAVDSTLLARALATDELLPALINAAVKNAPEMKRLNGGVELASSNMAISKNIIFNSLSLISGYQYGTNYSAINNPASTGGPVNSFTSAQTGFYNLGVGLQLPLTQIINRKHLIRAGAAQVKMAQAEQESGVLFVKQEVIRLYQELKLAHSLLMLSTGAKQAAQLNYIMSEKEFLRGQGSVEQLSKVLDVYTKAKIDHETYFNRLQTSFMQLELYIGTNLSTFLKKGK